MNAPGVTVQTPLEPIIRTWLRRSEASRSERSKAVRVPH